MMIVNNPNMLSSFLYSSGSVKGIDRIPVKIRGHGKLHFSFIPDSDKVTHYNEMLNGVYVSSSPFNIIPPQIIITHLNIKYNLHVDYDKNDDTEK